jgi:hypothetical protein
MLTRAAGKALIGAALDNPVLTIEIRVSLIDGLLAAVVLLGLVLDTALGGLVGRSGGRLRPGVLQRSRSQLERHRTRINPTQPIQQSLSYTDHLGLDDLTRPQTTPRHDARPPTPSTLRSAARRVRLAHRAAGTPTRTGRGG